MLAAISILTASLSAPQATLIREVRTVLQEQSVETLAPGIVESPQVGDLVMLEKLLGLPSPVPGVAFTKIVLSTGVEARLDLEVRGLDPGLTTVRPGINVGVYAAGSDASWGPIDQYYSGSALWSSAPPMIGPGETYALNDIVAFSDSAGYQAEAGSFQFDLVQQMPLFQVGIGAMVTALSTNQAGPVDLELVRMEQTTTIHLETNETFELSQVPVVSYCTSPANSTGATAALAAYGSLLAGSQWLSLEVTHLPDQAAALLFTSDSPASIPLGTAQLCVGGAIRRVGGVQIVNQGSAVFHVDLNSQAPGVDVHFQVFHRDPVLGLAASEGVRFTVQ